MPIQRCLWCTSPPFEEVAVLKWRGDDRQRLTVPLCRKHLDRLKKAGTKGRETAGLVVQGRLVDLAFHRDAGAFPRIGARRPL